MITLAFLQNPWFKPGTPQRYIDLYATDQKFHRRVLALSATGRALMRAFGDDYDEIVWDNANPKSGETREHVEKPDFVYMANRVSFVRPDVVLLFGGQAHRGWEQICDVFASLALRRIVLHAPHPMARGSANEHLKKIAAEYRRLRHDTR